MFDELLKVYRDDFHKGRYGNLNIGIGDADAARGEPITCVSPGERCFSDIDYDGLDRASWRACTHLYRLKALAKAYREGDGSVGIETLTELLAFWLARDPLSENWWYNMIGVPTELCAVAVLLWDELAPETRILVLSRIARGVVFIRNDMSRWDRQTGANMLWLSFITMTYAILARDTTLFRHSVSLAEGETHFGTEGIQRDGSFFQHGRRLYSGGYGRSFIGAVTPMIRLASVTPYAFSEDSLERIMIHVSGLSHMIHRTTLDYAVVGREYVREGALDASRLITALELLFEAPGLPRKTELQTFISALKARTPTFDGVKVFAEAGYLCMQKDGVFIAHKGTPYETVDAETFNGENLLGYNLSFGTHTTVMQTGREYCGIHAVWDYALIPGTSVPYMNDEELLCAPAFNKRVPTVTEYAAYSDGDVAVMCTDVTHEGIRARVAAFATPYGMVLLGNSLSDEKGRRMLSTVEQCIKTGDVLISDTEVRHGQVVYKCLDPDEKLTVKTETRTASMKRNRQSNPDREARAEILTVTLDRGEKDSYAYVIAPTTVSLDGLTVVSNTENEQSVKLPDGRIINAKRK